MRRQILFNSVLVMFLTLSFSCGNSTSPVVHVIEEGAWTGALLGEAITFTVEESQVKNLQLTFIYWGLNLPADTVIWTPDDAEITSNEFHMSDTLTRGYYSYSMNINGTFDPPSEISGMFGTMGAFDSLGAHLTTSDSLSWSGNHD